MTTQQKLTVRASEIREKLNELAGTETLTDEQRSEVEKLSNEYRDVETKLRAATIAGDQGDGKGDGKGDDQDPERKEYRELLEGADVGEIVAAAMGDSTPEGATRELQQEHKLGINQVPLSLLSRNVEVRTTGVTPAPGDVGQNQQPIIPAVFPMGATAFLRIAQDSVGVGETVYTVLSTSATPGTPAEGAEQAHSTAGFTATVLSPGRIQASVFYSRESRAKLSGMGESLRMNLSDALSDKLDEEVLDSLLVGTTLGANNATEADTYASYRKRFAYDAVDGIWASTVGDLRVLVGADTYGDMAASYRSDSDSMNALGALMGETGGVRVTAHAPTTASNKQNGVVRIGGRKDYALGIWDGISIIVDEVTQAKAGEIVLTAVMLYAKSVLRVQGFRKVQAQHS